MPLMVEKGLPAPGISADRRWGVAAHLERLDPATESPQEPGVPFNWAAVYQDEQQKLKQLEVPPPR
jgi:hypothetical protein